MNRLNPRHKKDNFQKTFNNLLEVQIIILEKKEENFSNVKIHRVTKTIKNSKGMTILKKIDLIPIEMIDIKVPTEKTEGSGVDRDLINIKMVIKNQATKEETTEIHLIEENNNTITAAILISVEIEEATIINSKIKMTEDQVQKNLSVTEMVRDLTSDLILEIEVSMMTKA